MKKIAILISLIVFSFYNVNGQIPINGLVAYYPFNGNADDESGNSNNGTVNGATLTTDRFGNVNSAYSFNGTSDFIRCLNAGPTGNPTITASFWLKTNTTQSGHIIGYGSDGVSGGDFRIHINHPWCPSGIAFDTYSNIKAYSTSFTDNWDFYVVIYDSTLGNNTSISTIYRNGVLLESVCANTHPSVTNISSQFPITFGRYHGTVQTVFYNGLLDDIRIYNRVLSQSEINSLYLEPNPSTVGIIKNTFDRNIIVYPNPINGLLTVELGESLNLFSVIISDINGREIRKLSYKNTNRIEMNLDVQSGIYLLTIKSDDKKATIRIIKN